MTRALAVLLVMTGIVAAPFLLRPDGRPLSQSGAERLVIISPHNETIRTEFEAAFVRHMRETEGRKVHIDWRQPGGTAEIALFLKSEYERIFRNEWIEATGEAFTQNVRESFATREPGTAAIRESLVRYAAGDFPGFLRAARVAAEARAARERFLASSEGIGIDLFFGGGAFDFQRQADAGALVARDASGRHGPAVLALEKPEWFSDAVYPPLVGGEPYRDAQLRWLGCCLSSFGICYNVDVLRRLGIEPPTQWRDLGEPAYLGQIALADPAKSGSATKAFEMILQQRMQEAQGRGLPEPEAIAEGWLRGLQLIQRISANGRYYTDAAPKIPHDVAAGDAAAGMCIDFYGRTYNELYRQPDGGSRIQFIAPVGGTSTGVDPIGLLRGAPSPELAHRFIEFVLSPEGQRLWNYRPGSPGGPRRVALRRLPVRRDAYLPTELTHFTDPEVLPYEYADAFTYRESWTGPVFGAFRFILRIGCVENHIEQRKAWRALVQAGFPPEAAEAFDDLDFVGLEQAREINAILRSKNKVAEVRLAKELGEKFHRHYERVTVLARTSGH